MAKEEKSGEDLHELLVGDSSSDDERVHPWDYGDEEGGDEAVLWDQSKVPLLQPSSKEDVRI